MKKKSASRSAFFNLRVLVGLFAALTGVLLALAEFLVGQLQARPELLRPLERHAHHLRARPDPLEIRIAPGRLRRRVGFRGLRTERDRAQRERRRTQRDRCLSCHEADGIALG